MASGCLECASADVCDDCGSGKYFSVDGTTKTCASKCVIVLHGGTLFRI